MSFRVSKKDDLKYYYALDHHDAVKVRWLGVLGIFSTLNLIGGFYFFVTHSFTTFLLFTPLSVIVLLYVLINAIIMSQYPGFSIEKHNDKIKHFYDKGKFPNIAVMIPAAGEDVSVVRQTLTAALKISYPNYQVYLLDDSKDGLYRQMTEATSAIYYRRKNVGVHKKAGNLNSLLARIDNIDNILVLDADFVPNPDILKELAPYAESSVGIVQSPQHFKLTKDVYRRSKFEYGAALIQRDFYRITQVARNKLGGAICVGTNALYNVEALRSVGGYEGVGPKDWGHSEDVYTGLKMLHSQSQDGTSYRIEYVPVMLAEGTCPDDHLSFYKQQNRWATGSMQLILSPMTLFSKKLTIAQKLCYLSNSVYYFYTIALLFSPLQILYIALAGVKVDWSVLIFFAPSLLLNALIIPIILRRTFHPIAGSLVVISNAYTFVQALLMIIAKRPLGWEATGAKSAHKKNYHFITFKILCSVSFIVIYLSTLLVVVVNDRIDLSPTLVIIASFIIGLIIHIIYLHHMLASMISIKKVYMNIHAYAYLLLLLITVLISGLSAYLASTYNLEITSSKLEITREHKR